MTSFKYNVRMACYDEDGGAGEDTLAAGNGGDGKPKTVTMTQEEFDKKFTDRMKKERAERQAERQSYIEKLEALQTTGMTAAEKEVLENQIEELRVANLTKEEQARRAKDKADKEWEQKYQGKEQEATTWKKRHDSLLVDNSITSAAAKHKALPQALAFLSDHLAPRTRLIEIKDEDGQPTGQYVAHVKLASADDKGKVVELDLTVDEAIKTMRETPDQYGMLFEGTAVGGQGANSGKPQGKPNIEKMDLDSFRETYKPSMKV
jgi:hypothetical protein